MHGPIPMKIESCRAEMVRACLSPAQLLRVGSVQATVIGLRAFGRRTHEDEWDEVRSVLPCALCHWCVPWVVLRAGPCITVSGSLTYSRLVNRCVVFVGNTDVVAVVKDDVVLGGAALR